MTLKGIGSVVAVAVAIGSLSSACALDEEVAGASRIERASPAPSADASKTSPPVESSPAVVPLPVPSAAIAAAERCPRIGLAELDAVVGRAISGVDDTTAVDGWSRACAWLRPSDRMAEPRLVEVQVGWRGTLHEYRTIAGAQPVAGLADEAYSLEGGERIALRSGELVAVVRYAGDPAVTATIAHRLAHQLRSEDE
jgi:hypothetical protein